MRHDGGWLINGRKTFISNVGTDMSFGVTLLARTETGDAENAGGAEPSYATFVVEKDTAGFTIGPRRAASGWKGLDTRAVVRRRVVAMQHLVGDPAMD